MPLISSRDHEHPSPDWARGLLSFPFCGRAAEAPAATCAALGRGPGPKRLAGRALRQATGLLAGSEPRLRGVYLLTRRQGVLLRGQPGPLNSRRRPWRRSSGLRVPSCRHLGNAPLESFFE
ncbi:hypothetical protein NDU88_007255 [Pleurodeles waltl]|uniref:Uncharacterized protein n=1 Tax=Pleurodeles waltl TaxID=8319 RepID=A0AAV7NUB1_PLEWA|nr:hypothetical protein NDU88_007255 [Pleurodeles waltl]